MLSLMGYAGRRQLARGGHGRHDSGANCGKGHSSTGTRCDGLPGSEGGFVNCSFWLVGALARGGKVEDRRAR